MTVVSLLVRIVRHRARRAGLALLAIAAASGAFAACRSASQVAVLGVQAVLGGRRAGEYDILVRPPDSRTQAEVTDGLVAPNHLGTVPGGITDAQYQAIRTVPGVELAAPVAVLGYYESSLWVRADGFAPGAYAVRCASDEGDGPGTRRGEAVFLHYIGLGSSALYDADGSSGDIWSRRAFPGCYFGYRGLVVAIDPVAEASLLGLDTAAQGRYLAGQEAAQGDSLVHPETPAFGARHAALINGAPYLAGTMSMEIALLALPPDVLDAADLAARGGGAYLQALPKGDILLEFSVPTGLHAAAISDAAASGMATASTLRYSQEPLPIRYRAAIASGGHAVGPVVELVSAEQHATHEIAPRPAVTLTPVAARATGALALPILAQGSFDLARRPSPEEGVARLELYASPSAVLRYDEEGRAVEPVTLQAGLQPQPYLPPPPTFLLPLEAARAVAGEDAIGAVRVRVGGIEDLSPEAWARIEGVAGEIARRTGLGVDVVTGSTTRPVLVRVPGVGYVEQEWIQRGVAHALLDDVAATSRRVGWAVGALGGLLVVGAAGALGRERKGEYALLEGLGWGRGSMVGLAVGGGLLAGGVGAGAGLLLALLVGEGAGWPLPPAEVLLAVPAAGVACGAGQALAVGRGTARMGRAGWCGQAAVALLATAVVALLPGLLAPLEAALGATPLGEAVAGEVAPLLDVLAGLVGGLAALLLAHALWQQVTGCWGSIALRASLGWGRASLLAALGRSLLPLVVGAIVGGAAGTVLRVGVLGA